MPGKEREMSIREVRSQFAAVIHDASVYGTLTYVTNRNRRVAVIAPLAAVEKQNDAGSD